MTTSIDRRRLLQLIFAVGAAAALPEKPAFAAGTDCGPAWFDGLDMASIQELGREYQARRPVEAGIEAVARLLASSSNEDEAVAELRTKVLADFAAGRIVNLSGWFVSETEGCVFAALSRCGF